LDYLSNDDKILKAILTKHHNSGQGKNLDEQFQEILKSNSPSLIDRRPFAPAGSMSNRQFSFKEPMEEPEGED